MNYFITAVYHKFRWPFPDKIDTRTFGYYTQLDQAMDAVKENRCNMHECLYNFLVIEEIEPGIHPQVLSDYWYRWEDDGWQRLCSKPECFNGIINWAIG